MDHDPGHIVNVACQVHRRRGSRKNISGSRQELDSQVSWSTSRRPQDSGTAPSIVELPGRVIKELDAVEKRWCTSADPRCATVWQQSKPTGARGLARIFLETPDPSQEETQWLASYLLPFGRSLRVHGLTMCLQYPTSVARFN